MGVCSHSKLWEVYSWNWIENEHKKWFCDLFAWRLKLFMRDLRVYRWIESNICRVTFNQFMWPSFHSPSIQLLIKFLKKIGARMCCVISEQTAYPPSATHPSLHRDTSFNELHDVKSRWKEKTRKSIDMKWFFLRPYSNRRVSTLSYVFMSRKCQSEYDKTTFFAVVWLPFTIFMLRPSHHSFYIFFLLTC